MCNHAVKQEQVILKQLAKLEGIQRVTEIRCGKRKDSEGSLMMISSKTH